MKIFLVKNLENDFLLLKGKPLFQPMESSWERNFWESSTKKKKKKFQKESLPLQKNF